jgi:hypothetical protein
MKSIILVLLSLSSNAFALGQLNYKKTIKLSDYKGQTYFSLMQETIKPQLDQMATNGFDIATGSTLVNALKKVDSKVASNAIRSAGGMGQLKQIGNELSASFRNLTFKQLPSALAKEGVGQGRYDLATYVSLASGGGVAVLIDANNITYNVNYGTGKEEDDERTGRSFGESNARLALDASDKQYLSSLEDYIRKDNSNTRFFYQSLLEVLLNNDATHYKQITNQGQAVATDFLAVYTAEQDRHLMSNLSSHPWDESLLEVTLLSAFHAGQKKIKLIFNGEFTDTTVKQAPGCSTEKRMTQKASLTDYWQFSSSTDPENCSRSGLNISRKDFRKLGSMITAYEKQVHPDIVAKVQRHFKTQKGKNNVFAQLSDFLISFETPKRLDSQTLQLAQDFSAFLVQVKTDADSADRFIVTHLQADDLDESGDN